MAQPSGSGGRIRRKTKRGVGGFVGGTAKIGGAPFGFPLISSKKGYPEKKKGHTFRCKFSLAMESPSSPARKNRPGHPSRSCPLGPCRPRAAFLFDGQEARGSPKTRSNKIWCPKRRLSRLNLTSVERPAHNQILVC